MHICSYMHKEKMMLSESDLYNSNTAPDAKINPKSLGAMWINYSNGRHYICSNNTMNKNTWLDPIGQLTIDFNNIIERLTNEFNSNIENLTNDTNNRFNTINSNINKLTTDTNNSINGINNKIDITNGNINNITKYMNSNVNSINGKINEINARIDSIKPDGLGYDQQWYDLTSERIPGVTYYNNTGKPIIVMISAADIGFSRLCLISFVVNGLTVITGVGDNGNNPGGSAFSVIIPIGASYQLIYNSPQTPISIWAELR